MEQLVRVRQCYPDGSALVVHIRESACSGDCHKCSGCGAAQETITLTAKNAIGAAPGALVYIRSDSGPVLKAAAVFYVVPMVLFFLGYLLGASLWNAGALVACLAFVGGIGLTVAYDRLVMKKQKTEYTITGFAADRR